MRTKSNKAGTIWDDYGDEILRYGLKALGIWGSSAPASEVGTSRTASDYLKMAGTVALDFIPVVGQLKAAEEVWSGKELLTGERINRGLAALGLVPGGKLAYTALKGLGKTGSKVGLVGGKTAVVEEVVQKISNEGSITTRINDSVSFVEKKLLLRGIQRTFLNEDYLTVITESPVTLYRKFGGAGNQAKVNGGFATTIKNASRGDTAVFQKWSNQRFEAQIIVPENIQLNIEKVAPQLSKSGNRIYHRGGEDQILLPRNYPTTWIKQVRDGMTGNTYTIEQFIKKFPDQIIR